MLKQILILLLTSSLVGCSTYKGGNSSRVSIGKDTATELVYEDEDKSFYYSTGANESKSFKELLETVMAAIITLGAADAWKNGVENID